MELGQRFNLGDDSGLLAVVDAERYVSFVDPDWTYESLLSHFRSEMKRKAIVVWECGDGGNDYSIVVRKGFTDEQGFRAISGPLEASTNTLHLASYTALTMAAQFREFKVPSQEERDLAFGVPERCVRIRIIQMYDPDNLEEPKPGDPHFVVEVEPGMEEPWTNVAWETAEAAVPDDETKTPRVEGLFDKLSRLLR